MKVKVDNKIYDSEKEPVMVILNKGEREQIANMSPDAKKYCVYPEATKYCVYPDDKKWIENNYKAIKEWMKDV